MDIYNNDNKFNNKPKNIKNKKNYEKFGYIINPQVSSQPIARYFVIKSVDEDNIHKVNFFLSQSIKYRIWCSTIKGNQKLNKAMKEADGKYPIYLFFRSYYSNLV